MGGVYRYTSLSRISFAFKFSHAHVTHSSHFSTFTGQCRIENSFHQVIRRRLALCECDGCHYHYHKLTLSKSSGVLYVVEMQITWKRFRTAVPKPEVISWDAVLRM